MSSIILTFFYSYSFYVYFRQMYISQFFTAGTPTPLHITNYNGQFGSFGNRPTVTAIEYKQDEQGTDTKRAFPVDVLYYDISGVLDRIRIDVSPSQNGVLENTIEIVIKP